MSVCRGAAVRYMYLYLCQPCLRSVYVTRFMLEQYQGAGWLKGIHGACNAVIRTARAGR